MPAAICAIFCLISCARIMPLILEKRVDRWEIRCRFNRARYRERLDNGEFLFDQRKRRPVPAHANLPQDFKFSIEWYYIEPHSGDEVAHGHCYELADGSTTPHDPKHLFLNGVRYSLFRGTGWWRDRRRDPSLFFEHGTRLREFYVRWRKFKCDHWGR